MTSKWPQRYITPVSPKTGNALMQGTGECERVTVLMARSNYTKIGTGLAIAILGTLVFGGLVLVKGTEKKIEVEIRKTDKT